MTYTYGEHFRTSNIIVVNIPKKRMPKTTPITTATSSSASDITGYGKENKLHGAYIRALVT